MYEIMIKTQFSAAHRLRYYDGKFENLHGHNWSATVVVEAKELDAIGLGIDFVKLKEATDGILSRLDYSLINEVPPFDEMNPSAENIARWLFLELAGKVNAGGVRVKRVEVREFEHSGAAYFE
jgi:6-pyruvoyltetrahydropterin/6-carboxytetrahydropterin synthase